MRCTVVALLSTAVFSLGALAHPSPPQPAAISSPLGKRYQSGWCGVHVKQYQKNEADNSEYILDVTLYDALQDQVGAVTGLSAPGGSYQDIDSKLPYVFEVEVGANDQQPVMFMYSGQAWSSHDKGQCKKVGGFQNGNRDMNCGFNC